MLFDTHMHTKYSCDSQMTLLEAQAAAQKQGVGMIVTEHWDRDYPTNPEMFSFPIAEYLERYQPYRSETLLLGIEIGMQPHVAAADKQLVQQYQFDQVIGSMHCMRGKDLYEPEAYQGLTREQAITALLEDTVTCLRAYGSAIDTLGHIDYICRYMPYDDKEFHYAEHDRLWDEVFITLIADEKALEINTRRLDQPSAVEHLLHLYRRFHELGGRYVTLGSDAHYQEHVGRRLDIAYQIAEQCKLQPVYFKQRQRQICSK